MIILSNINKDCSRHDGIKYTPIEKQIYDELVSAGITPEYKPDEVFSFLIENCYIKFFVKKGKINFFCEPIYDFNDGLYCDIKPLELKANVNVKIDDIWNNILGYVKNINDFQREYKALPHKFNDAEIEEELSGYFNNGTIKCRYFTHSMGTSFGFYLTSIDGAPADGVYYKAITPTEFKMSEHDSMDNLLYKMHLGDGVDALKKKLSIIDYIEGLIGKFDLKKFPLALEKYEYTLMLGSLLNKYRIQSRYS